ncbi:MAG: helix-turn-helix domain-containing protein [Hyphomonas sp.]
MSGRSAILPQDSSARRRTTRRGEETRRQLIRAAVDCLSERGYAATSIEAVMERAGASRGSVLHQFPTRTDLIAAAVEAAMEAMIADTRARMRALPDPQQRYRSMCDLFWETQNIPEGAAVTEALLAARWDDALARALRPIAARIEAEIDDDTRAMALAAGAADADACIVHARVLVLTLRGITLELMFDKERTMIHRALEEIRAQHSAHCDQVLGAGRG